MRIRSYRALRPVPELASRIASLPYDVVSTAESRALVEGNPDSMLRVARSDLEFSDQTDPYSEPVYARAKENWDRLIRDGRLVREDGPSVYIYRQQMGHHVQTGVAALCHVEDYDAGLIKKHEKTRKDKEDDRVRHTNTLSANPGPVFLTYRGQDAIDALVAQATLGAPLIDFIAHTGVRHRVWRVSAPQAIVEAFAAVPCTYIADGHHRAASAARVARERRAANANHTGSEDYNWFLAVLFPAAQLRILPYNRLVADLNGRTPAQLLAELAKVGSIAPAASADPARPGDVRVHLEGAWHTLTLTPSPQADPVSRLDVSLLQDRVLAPMLAIDDPRTSKRIDFVGGIRGTKFLEDAVKAGRAKIAFSMHAVTIEQLMDIADAGQIMPPKSTWFEPKLLDGLFMHTF